jgi:dimethylpropiothetin dethiomethylase
MAGGIEGVIEALEAAWRAGIADDAEAAPHLLATLARLEAARETMEPAPSAQPATRFLAEAVPLTAHPESAALAAALFGAAGTLAWQPAYPELGHDPRYADFRAGYAYAELAGPRGPVVTPDLAAFVTIQAPGVTYPAHAHRAFEVYYVVAGRAEWRRGEEDWSLREPGTFVVHRSGQAHAMRTGAEPLLAAAVWLDHLDGPSLMVGT